MTIDERLDRLTARHEALTQSVELLVHSQQEMQNSQKRLQSMQRKNEVLLAHVIESIDRLAVIAQAHESRLSRLEGEPN